MSERFKVGLSQDLRRPDGTPVIANFDTSALDAHPRIQVQVLPRRGHLVILAPHALCFTDQCMAGNGKADTDAILAMVGSTPGR